MAAKTKHTAAERQRLLVLYGLLALVAVYTYWEVAVAPYRDQIRSLEVRQRTLDAETNRVYAEIKSLRSKDAQLANEAADQLSSRLVATIPDSQRVEIPSAIKVILAGNKLHTADVHLLQLSPFGSLPDVVTASWQFKIDAGTALQFGPCLAELENLYPLSQVTAFRMDANSGTGTISASASLQIVVTQ